MTVFMTMHFSAIVIENPNIDTLTAMMQVTEHIKTAPFDCVFDINAIGTVTIVGALGLLILYNNSVSNRHDMAGKEHGSAKWNDNLRRYNTEFADPVGQSKNAPDGRSQNMILSQKIRLSMEGSKTQRNCNVCVIGGSGSGKSRFIIKPNLLQANCSYIVTDPKGELLESTGSFLAREGYDVKVFNTIDFASSNRYNPFHYLHTDTDVLKMISVLIKNTTPAGSSKGDPFWEKSETALLTAICLYLYHRCPEEDQHFGNVMRLLELAEIDEDNPNSPSILDFMYAALDADAKREAELAKVPYVPDLAVRQYRIFKMAAGKTAKSILVSAGTRLAYFQMPDIANLVASDDIDLTTIGDKKTALYCLISASDSTFNFLVAMLYNQMFDELYLHATKKYHGSLPIPVRFLLDEFANIGQIPEFDKKLATMRSYKISCTIVLQTVGQLKSNYKDDWETILGNCDTKIYLGGDDKGTTEYVSGILGKGTITTMSRGRSMGKSGSSNKNFQSQARDLMTTGELGLMNNKYEIVMVRGVRPFYDRKFNYPRHPNYGYTGDANKKNIYNFREILAEKEAKRIELKRQKYEFEKRAEAERKKREHEFEMMRRNQKVQGKATKKSLAGRECLTPNDADVELKEDSNREEILVEANIPESFDALYEFRDGRECSIEEALADCQQMLTDLEDADIVELEEDSEHDSEDYDELEAELAAYEASLNSSDGEDNLSENF